jgi:hypothetical protein
MIAWWWRRCGVEREVIRGGAKVETLFFIHSHQLSSPYREKSDNLVTYTEPIIRMYVY